MTLRLSLPETSVDVAAGQSALLDVRLTNTGLSRCSVWVEVTGRAAAWVRLTAASDGQPLHRDGADGLELEAGSEATLSLLVAPPRAGGVSDRLIPFTVRAVDRATGAPSASATGLVLVRPPAPVTGTLAPERVTGRRAARHVLHLTSDDPVGALVTLRGVAEDRRTRVTVEPVALRVDAGRPVQAEVTVEARSTLLRRRTHGFEVVWETEGPDGLVRGATRGRLEQIPVLPPLATFVLALALGAVLAFGAWQARPFGADRQTGSPEQGRPRTSPGPTEAAPTRPFVVVDVRLKTPSAAVSLREAQSVADAAPVGGSQRARVVDGADTAGLDPQFWVVVVDGFSTVGDAQAYCEAREPLDCSVVD